MENYRQELLKMAKDHRRATGISLAYIGTLIMRNARFFKNLEDGGGCTVDSYLKAKRWLSENKVHKKSKRTSNLSTQATYPQDNKSQHII